MPRSCILRYHCTHQFRKAAHRHHHLIVPDAGPCHGKLLIPQQVLHSTKKPFHIAIRCGGKVAAEHIEAGIPYIRLINGSFIVCPRVITCHFKSSAGGDTIPLGHGIESKLQFDQS